MAAARFTDPIEPMDLANMRQNGVRSLAVRCHQCLHEVIMNVDHLPGDMTVPSFGRRLPAAATGSGLLRLAHPNRAADSQAVWRIHSSHDRRAAYATSAVSKRPLVSGNNKAAAARSP
jgi:hypothetical protein